jgi:hypothetical protein
MNTKKLTRLKIISLIGIGALALAGFRQMYNQYSVSRLQQEPLKNLDVPVIKQLTGTSCGEAIIAMAYSYAYPQTPLSEQEIIDYATAQGYFTPGVPPFTSPANMVKIAEYYTDNISTGTVKNSSEGLLLLIGRLRSGDPVIIDVLSNFSDLESEAHFILVTGVSVDAARGNAVVIHYNDPLTGTKKSGDWYGTEGVWNAWQNNGDPGGSGWWMVIATP